jgi:hypothetical protein
LKFHFATSKIRLKAVTAVWKHTFLHWTANFSAYEITRFWIKNIELTIGLYFHDEINKFPDELSGLERFLSEVNPLYQLFLEARNRTAETASVEGFE